MFDLCDPVSRVIPPPDPDKADAAPVTGDEMEREFSLGFDRDDQQAPGFRSPLGFADCHIGRVSPGHSDPLLLFL
jgi:hypothetical protein